MNKFYKELVFVVGVSLNQITLESIVLLAPLKQKIKSKSTYNPKIKYNKTGYINKQIKGKRNV